VTGLLFVTVPQERADIGVQLDSLKGQMQAEARELVAQRAKELDEKMETRTASAMGSLERALHRALDESLDKLKGSTMTEVTKHLDEVVTEVKNRQDYLQHRLDGMVAP
jgi:hypothetical protein